jgi:PAS domain S-box-containing protein
VPVPRLIPHRSAHAAPRVGLLARMHVGTKLMLLVLLPTCALVAFASITAIDHWRTANSLREFRSAAQLSFPVAHVADALADERTAATIGRLGVRRFDRRRIAAAQRAVDAAFRRATGEASEEDVPVDVAGRLAALHRQLVALRLEAAGGSLGDQEIVERYGVIARGLLGIVRDLDSGRPSGASGKAATADVALVRALEGAEQERVTLAAALIRGTESVRVRGVIVEADALDDFRHAAAGRLVADLNALLFEPAGVTVQRVRELMVRDPASIQRRISLERWLDASGTRIRALRRLERETEGELAATASADLDAARASAWRAVAASFAVLVLLTGLGLALRRSIIQPLGEVSQGARRLTAGQLASGVTYAGRDEIGEVAAAFRDLRGTAERLAAEIRTMNVAVADNQLDHRASDAALAGTWAELIGGMNDTMAAFAELQGRREQAERQADRVFELSQDLLCIAGFDGYFKRVNPAFERLLGYPAETLLSRPTREFVHPDDRAARDEGHARLEAGEDVLRFDLRQLCSDGSVRLVEWSARVVGEERRIYAVGRDVTETRRAADEQAALRRVATLVAQDVAPGEIFAAVAREVRALFDAVSAVVVRFEPDGSTAVLGSAPQRSGATHEGAIAAVAHAGSARRTDGAVGAPIVVEDRLWGAVAVAEGAESLPTGAEERLARFTELVATAIANAESRAEVAASRARVVAAGDEERRRVVRDLHDGAQQRLVHTVVTLELAALALEGGGGGAPALVAEAVENARRANEELRALSHGIQPAALTSGGVSGGVESLVSRMRIPVATDVSVGRLPAVVEATAYFVVSEALTNIVKHARAASADVSVHVEGGSLRIAVRDDGVGGARPDGDGLVGLRDRLEALDGRLLIDSPVGSGTLVAAEIPLAGHPGAQGAQAPDSELSGSSGRSSHGRSGLS